MAIGVVLSHKLATLKELQTYYSYNDLLDMVELIQVNNYNEHLALQDY